MKRALVILGSMLIAACGGGAGGGAVASGGAVAGSGAVAGGDVTSPGAGGSTPPPPVSHQLAVQVQGMTVGDAVTVTNGSDTLTFAADGSKSFTLAAGGAYDLSVRSSLFEACTATGLKGSAGSGDPAPVTIACTPRSNIGSVSEQLAGMAVVGDLVYLADVAANQVHVRRRSDNVEVQTIGAGGAPGKLDGPAAQAQFGSVGPLVYSPTIGVVMLDRCNGTLRVLGDQVRTLAGQASPRCDGSPVPAGALAPDDISVAPDGNIWVAEHSDIRVVAPDGTVSAGPVVPADVNIYHTQYLISLAASAGGTWYGESLDTLFRVDAQGNTRTLLYVPGRIESLDLARAGASGDAYTCWSKSSAERYVLRLAPDGHEVARVRTRPKPYALDCVFALVGGAADEQVVLPQPLGSVIPAFADGRVRDIVLGAADDVFLFDPAETGMTHLSGWTAAGVTADPFATALGNPLVVAADRAGHIGVLTNSGAPSISILDSTGAVQRTIAQGPLNTFPEIGELALSDDGRVAVVNDPLVSVAVVRIFSATGTDELDIPMPTLHGLTLRARALAFDQAGRLYVAASATDGDHILVVAKGATTATPYKDIGAGSLQRIVPASNGNIYFQLSNDPTIWQIDSTGAVSKVNIVWQGPTVAGLAHPTLDVTLVGERGGWLYGWFNNGMARVKLP